MESVEKIHKEQAREYEKVLKVSSVIRRSSIEWHNVDHVVAMVDYLEAPERRQSL